VSNEERKPSIAAAANKLREAMPWLRFLVGILIVAVPLWLVDGVLVLFAGSDMPNPHTGQIYRVSFGKYGGSAYVEFWLYVFDSLVMTTLSLAILSLVVRHLYLGRTSKGEPT
jgi:hypothetical protein